MGIETHGGPISGNPELCAELFHKGGNEYAGILYEPCSLASAGVDYRRAFVVASMESIGYEGDYALEYEVHVEAPETGIAKWLDWFLKI